MSFVAVVGLIAAYEAIQANRRHRRRFGLNHSVFAGPIGIIQTAWMFMFGTIATTVIAGVATAKFAAFHFYTGQLYSVITKMLAIPVPNLVVMPVALMGFIVIPLGVEAIPYMRWVMA